MAKKKLKTVWMRKHKPTSFVPCVWYFSKKECRESFAKFYDKKDYTAIQVELWQLNVTKGKKHGKQKR